MSEYGVKESWTRLFTIGPVFGVERPMGFWSNGGVFMESSSMELLLYNRLTQQFMNLGVSSVARPPRIHRGLRVESQVSLNGEIYIKKKKLYFSFSYFISIIIR
ncbi:hypothetical protein PVL29_019302 [Vitis rotundifolia]|uniref:Uncharacterized protein n=1 Tax=Vitis rotundifolia TaxID=103349 RepID=A0AA38Z860_VITRO|nr:hypothetical protein PVL29_019302 [Vitis rotundifolia]